MQSLKESFLFKEFGVLTTGDQYINGNCISKEPSLVDIYQKDEDKKITGEIDLPEKLNQFRALLPSSSNFVPLIRVKNGESFPVALVGYGKGYLLHAGIFLEDSDSEEFVLLVEILNGIIKNKFKNI